MGLVACVFASGCTATEPHGEAFVELPPEPSTPALSFQGFDPSNIISDEEFFNFASMTEVEIADFISTWNEGCRTGEDGTPCLNDYREDTPGFDPDQYCPGGFEAVAQDSAASIIWRAAQACKINPQVILVTLQKEQGLITASGARLVPWRYSTAMGYACPDSADCDELYKGFANQVYHGARQMRIYEFFPEKYLAAPGSTSEIKYAYPPECGASEVFVQNQATANLYNYTPYQPNANAQMGIRGECESVGNLNFYAYFHAWFGQSQ